MYTTQSTTHRLPWSVIAVLPFALAACGDGVKVRSAGARTTNDSVKIVPVANVSTARETDPSASWESVPATYENADSVFKEKRYPEARALFERYVTSKPADARGQYMLGLAAWKSGEFKRAEDAFDKALELDPKNVRSYLNSARVLLDMDRTPEAMERIDKALAIDSVSPDGIRLKARTLAKLGKIDEAKEAYRQALVLNEEDAWAMNNLGMLELDRGNVTAALGPLARAVQLKPISPIFQNNLGVALERSGHRLAASVAYEAAIKAESTYAKAVRNLERLSAIVTDTTERDTFNVRDPAEQFRLEVKRWKEGPAREQVKPASDDVRAVVREPGR
ncbi:MAG: tetratricopeptide repeat protein [Gemmatimonadales bacterium]